MMKLALVYQRGDEWFLRPSSQTETGLWIATPPLIQLNSQDSKQRKYEALVQVLNASRNTPPLPTPTDWDAVVAPLLAKAKAKSWSTFVRDAKCIMVQLENQEMRIIPQRKLDRTGALIPIHEDSIQLSADATPEEFGAALEEVMTRCG